jgi:hypothetical protein
VDYLISKARLLAMHQSTPMHKTCNVCTFQLGHYIDDGSTFSTTEA